MIYFIKHTEYIKIGYTDLKIQNRLSQLQVSCPVKLEVLGLINGDIDDEKKYHVKFANFSSSGEWFEIHPEIIDFINGLDTELMWKYGFIERESSPIGIIKSCRLEIDLSMEELGKRLGLTKQSVSDMQKREINGSITIKTVCRTLKAMGYKFEYRAVKMP